MPESDDAVRKAAERRIEQQQQADGSPAEAPQRLPAPKTWDEYTTGVVAWLDYHWKDHNCPYCHNQIWRVGRVAALASAPSWPTEGNFGFVGMSPAVQVICVQCGHTVLVNALWIFEPQNRLSPPEAPQ